MNKVLIEDGNKEKNIDDIVKTIDSIKQDVINTRNKIMYNANRELINMYFNIKDE